MPVHESTQRVPDFPLVAERSITRRDPLPELARDSNRERQARYCQGFDPDWWMPALVAQEWRSFWYPLEATHESVQQWQDWIDAYRIECVGPLRNPKRADELEAEKQNGLALIRQCRPQLVEKAGARMDRIKRAVADFLFFRIPERLLPISVRELAQKLHSQLGCSEDEVKAAISALAGKHLLWLENDTVNSVPALRVWFDERQVSEPMAADHDPATPVESTRRKRSTRRGDAQAKIIAALTKHHQFEDGGCLNTEPIGVNELARQAQVAPSTVSRFFDKEFGGSQRQEGHAKYAIVCRDAGRLADSLKVLRGEFSPHDLYGRRPPGEGDRDEE
jgi:hypothetical protein